MSEEYIRRTEHKNIVEACVREAHIEEEHARNELIRKHDEELRVKLKELEERKQHEYAVAMLNVRQGIKKLEGRLEEEKADRKELEKALEEERKAIASYRHRSDEDDRSKQMLVAHLEEVKH